MPTFSRFPTSFPLIKDSVLSVKDPYIAFCCGFFECFVNLFLSIPNPAVELFVEFLRFYICIFLIGQTDFRFLSRDKALQVCRNGLHKLVMPLFLLRRDLFHAFFTRPIAFSDRAMHRCNWIRILCSCKNFRILSSVSRFPSIYSVPVPFMTGSAE